jgi:uncharacterized protein (TIGR02594 family)
MTQAHPEPPWLTIARAELGVLETPGPESTPRILEYLAATRLPPSMHDDETPWCAAFVCWVLQQAGLEHTASAGARSYLRWGRLLTDPRLGCVVVLSRPNQDNPSSGHVGFWVGDGQRGPLILGGNQGNAVTIRPYAARRVLGYRWPRELGG